MFMSNETGKVKTTGESFFENRQSPSALKMYSKI